MKNASTHTNAIDKMMIRRAEHIMATTPRNSKEYAAAAASLEKHQARYAANNGKLYYAGK